MGDHQDPGHGPNQEPNSPRGSGRNLWITLVGLAGVCLLGAYLFNLVLTREVASSQPVPISDLVEYVRAGQVQRLVVRGDTVDAELSAGEIVRSEKEPGVGIVETLRQFGVSEEQVRTLTVVVDTPTDLGGLSWLVWLLPLGLMLVLLSSRRGATGGGADANQAMAFARSRARVLADRPQVGFADVAGVEEAKQELAEVVEFLRDPTRFAALGARIPRGVLLAGPPGTGKTLLARAVAGEAQVAFFSINASEFVELFVGIGASRVRDLFKQAREQAPCIVFIDEIDAIGRRRGSGLGQSHEEREQTLNQILAELDGFDPRANVVVMASTNRPDVLDPALLRPGRFDRRVTVDNPDRDGRLAILWIHAKGKPFSPEVDLERVARATPGFSGADLENLLNEAALLAGRRMQRLIGPEELDEAADRVMAGPRRRGRGFTPWERELVAYHEAGHALVAHRLPQADPVHKISIVARGAAGGHTRVLPEDDRRFWTRSQLRDALAYVLGGLVAEELIFGEPTTGPGSDLERASEMARGMVLEYGMSERIGPVALGKSERAELFGTGPSYSEQTAAAVDAEVRRLVQEAKERARRVLSERREELDRLAAALQEQETLVGADLDRLLGPPLRSAAANRNPHPIVPRMNEPKVRVGEGEGEELELPELRSAERLAPGLAADVLALPLDAHAGLDEADEQSPCS